jgi:parvulin-like peptidyl-prolyl isomerase
MLQKFRKIYKQRNNCNIMATKEVTASHILFKSKEQAEEILEKIKNGSDFAYMAETFSKCPSGKNGGDLGCFKRGQMVPKFENVAFKLEVGEVSEIVPTQFGFHIIKRTA